MRDDAIFKRGAELDDADLEGVSGGNQGPAPMQPPAMPEPSIPSIPRDPSLPGATPMPTPAPREPGIGTNLQ